MNAVIEKPLLLSAGEAAGLLGIGRTTLYAMNSNGTLGPMPIRLGGRVLWRRDELAAWVSADCPNRERWQLKKGENNG